VLLRKKMKWNENGFYWGIVFIIVVSVEEFQGLWRKRPPALLPDLVCADCARAGKGKNQEG